MEFKNAESRRVQICLIGSSKLNQMVHSLIPEFRDVADITIRSEERRVGKECS